MPLHTATSSRPVERPASSAVPVPVPVRGGIRRWLLLAFAGTCLALAFVGVFVPGLPTTVFVLLAAWAAMRSSPRLHAWLEGHRWFGPLLRNWRGERAVGRRAKWTASVSMVFCAALCLATAPQAWVAWLGIAVMAIVAAWLWSRPEPSGEIGATLEAGSGNGA